MTYPSVPTQPTQDITRRHGGAINRLLKFMGNKGAAVPDITVTATSGSLPTANGSVTIANAATPTNAELLEYCRELESALEALLARVRAFGIIDS